MDTLIARTLSFTFHALQESNLERVRLIQLVNSNPDSTWVAGLNGYFFNKSMEHTRQLCGVRAGGPILPRKEFPENLALPDTFDSREAWPKCTSIAEVRDQSACGSCWALATTEAATDRWCIATGGQGQPHFSARDLLSCCSSCGFGCNGGYPSSAWSWLSSSGIVTGGNYNDFSSCVSYSMPNCDHHCTGKYPQCSTMSFDTPSCQKTCDSQSSYSTAYASDKHRFKAGYSVSGENAIMQEIQAYGPVGATFSVYSDFENYKSGVYSHTGGSYLGGHAIKIIGWGVDQGTKYWTIANSWNEDWGEQGFFRIKRGTNECGIEGGVTAGVPAV